MPFGSTFAGTPPGVNTISFTGLPEISASRPPTWNEPMSRSAIGAWAQPARIRTRKPGNLPARAPGMVEAPGPAAGCGEIEEHEAVKRGQLAAVEQGPEALSGVRHEIGECHLAGQNERDRPREQPDEQQRAADQLERSREADQREQRRRAGHRRGEAEQLLRAVRHEEKRGDNAQQAQQARRPALGDKLDHVGPFAMKKRILFLFLSAVLSIPQARSAPAFQSEEHAFHVTTIVQGLEHPWSLAFLPDGRMLVTERPGRLRVVAQGKLDPQPIAGLPQVAAGGQGGLFDVVLHPNHQHNQLLYLAYAARGDGGTGTELARARLNGRRLEDVQVLFRQSPKGASSIHFGGRIVFDRDGYLYLTLGERGQKERAQRPDDHAGSVIRLHDDGRVPQDNPFVGQPGWKPEKFDLGHRNMQGAALHPQTGMLWTHEHGPQGGDEINIIRPGTNYGWPVITYGANYVTGTRIGEGTTKPGMAQPLYYWVPSIAPSGMAFYTGARFPRWKENLFVGALRDEMLVRLVLDGEKIVKEERLLKGVLGRIRDVRSGPDGYLYLLTDETDGKLVRLEP